jgi:hypothetical protein
VKLDDDAFRDACAIGVFAALIEANENERCWDGDELAVMSYDAAEALLRERRNREGERLDRVDRYLRRKRHE